MEKPTSAVHRFIQCILPAKAFAAVKAGTKLWLVECPCGHTVDYWAIGGVRYMGAGEPRKLLRCPACRQLTWHKVRKKSEAERRDLS